MQISIGEALRQGISAHEDGRLQEAENIYRAILQIDSKHPDANHNLGVLAVSSYQPDKALPFLETALKTNPNIEQFWLSYIDALVQNDQTNDAEIAIKEFEEAGFNAAKIEGLRTQLKAQIEGGKPTPAHIKNLLRLFKDGETEEAKTLATLMTQKYPKDPLPWKILGAVLGQMGRNYEAVQACEDALLLSPCDPEIHSNLGNLRKALGKFDEAETSLRKALELKPDFIGAYSNLGSILLGKGDYEGSLNCFKRSFELKRGGIKPIGIEQDQPLEISKAKLTHDIEQFEYLASLSIQKKYLSLLADKFRSVRDEIDWPSDAELVTVMPKFKPILSNGSRIIHVKQAGRVKKALNCSLDGDAITKSYCSHDYGLTHVDNFLNTEALNKLREFLLESTIWFEVKKGGYLGAYLNDGLATPLIFQISSELKAKLPLIIGDHTLNQVWAYKYDNGANTRGSDLTGIKIHADFAAINVNFWVTQSEANQDPDSGGLVVYDTEAPAEWSFEMYNNNVDRIQEALRKSGGGRTKIPYQENRMVIFNSNLFHETDEYNFRPGYINRRINVTMLFGRRKTSLL